jgi:hypothetical protein
VGVEGVQDDLVGGGQLGRFGFGPGRGEFRNDLAGRDKFRQTRLGLGQSSVQVLDLLAQFASPVGGRVLPDLEICQEFDDVHAAATKSSRQAGAGVVRRRAMFAVDAQ